MMLLKSYQVCDEGACGHCPLESHLECCSGGGVEVLAVAEVRPLLPVGLAVQVHVAVRPLQLKMTVELLKFGYFVPRHLLCKI